MPMVRDVDISYYLRQDKNGLNLGPYERNCKAHWVTPDDPMPDDFSFQLYPDDLERLEFYIEDAMERMPHSRVAGCRARYQRADPLCAGRAAADRPDARR